MGRRIINPEKNPTTLIEKILLTKKIQIFIGTSNMTEIESERLAANGSRN